MRAGGRRSQSSTLGEMAAFCAAVQDGDVSSIVARLSPQVVFRGALGASCCTGPGAVERRLRAAEFRALLGCRYVHVVDSGPRSDCACVFTARVGECAVGGVDLLRRDGDTGLIVEWVRMIRPVRAARALSSVG